MIALVFVVIVTILLVIAYGHDSYREVIEKLQDVSKALPIYIINLPARKERLELLMERIEPKPDSYYVKSTGAVDGKEVIEGYLNKGQIGCWLSHVDAWKMIVDQSEPIALVLEDDAMIELPKMYDDILDVMVRLPNKWDVCYLGGRYADPEKAESINGNIMTSSSSRIWHSHAYLITKNGASKLLRKSSKFNYERTLKAFDSIDPLDDWMTNPSRHMRIFLIIPELIPFMHDDIHDTS